MTTFDNNVTKATITKEVNHEKIPGVVLHIEQEYTKLGWEPDAVMGVRFPIGTSCLSNPKSSVYLITDPGTPMNFGYSKKVIYFIPPKSSVIYMASASGISIARNNATTKKLRNFVQFDIKDIPKILTKLRAAKAFVVQTRLGTIRNHSVLVYNGHYIELGCYQGFEFLMAAGIINKEGKITKTKIDPEFLGKNFNSVKTFVDTFSQLEAE